MSFENSQYLHVESKEKDMKTSFDNVIEIFQLLHDTKQVLPFNVFFSNTSTVLTVFQLV